MVKITKEAALEYHESGRPGKIEVKPTKAYRTQTDLSLAYSPGVAFPCLEIQEDPNNAYKYTDKGNLVAVISNGTAVLGLGDIGAMSGKPVMEGKGLLFKIYGGIDVFDIEVAEKDPEKFCEAVERIAPTFGGINLEDIKAPECFYIEERLKKTLDIPVMHDDQHGTAIISAAGLKNAMEVIGKNIRKVKIVVNGAGAAAISCTKLYMAIGAQKENIVMLDSKGVISTERQDLNEQKKFLPLTALISTRWLKLLRMPTYSWDFRRVTCSQRRWSSRWQRTPSSSPLPTLCRRYPMRMRWTPVPTFSCQQVAQTILTRSTM